MFEQQKQQPKPKKEKGCEVEVKKTKTGKKISFSPGCSTKEREKFLEKETAD